jgi:hypothetical protein
MYWILDLASAWKIHLASRVHPISLTSHLLNYVNLCITKCMLNRATRREWWRFIKPGSGCSAGRSGMTGGSLRTGQHLIFFAAAGFRHTYSSVKQKYSNECHARSSTGLNQSKLRQLLPVSGHGALWLYDGNLEVGEWLWELRFQGRGCSLT